MKNLVTFNATEARQNFFRLLRLVEKGDEAVIVKQDQDLRFRLTVEPQAKPSTKKLLLKEISKIGLKSKSLKKMKDVFTSRYDL